MSDSNRNAVKNVAELLKSRNVSQAKVSESIGYDRSALNKQLSRGSLTSEMIDRLAEYFDVSTSYIISDNNMKNNKTYPSDKYTLEYFGIDEEMTLGIDPKCPCGCGGKSHMIINDTCDYTLDDIICDLARSCLDRCDHYTIIVKPLNEPWTINIPNKYWNGGNDELGSYTLHKKGAEADRILKETVDGLKTIIHTFVFMIEDEPGMWFLM